MYTKISSAKLFECIKNIWYVRHSLIIYKYLINFCVKILIWLLTKLNVICHESTNHVGNSRDQSIGDKDKMCLLVYFIHLNQLGINVDSLFLFFSLGENLFILLSRRKGKIHQCLKAIALQSSLHLACKFSFSNLD